jgi:predicted AAA+ superfamily ATPase
LDEIQRIPELMPAIKASVDRQRTPGRFLLTGSANLLLLPRVQESLAGRVEILNLHPLTEQEKQHNPDSFLARLLSEPLSARIIGEQAAISGVAEAVCSGGYPEPNTRTEARARQWHQQYLKAIIQRDVKDVAAIRDEDEMLRIAQILAYRTATLLNVSSLSNELDISRETADKYLSVLERLFLVQRLPAWHRNQAKRLIKSPKIHWVDSGLATTLNGFKTADWLDYKVNFGALLESFVVQQLIAQAGWLEDEIRFSHYRDKGQFEVDLVIEQGRKVWGVEVKKAASIQDKDGVGLAQLAAQSGDDFQGGVLFYCGNNCLPLAQKNCFAVPIDWLWRSPDHSAQRISLA